MTVPQMPAGPYSCILADAILLAARALEAKTDG